MADAEDNVYSGIKDKNQTYIGAHSKHSIGTHTIQSWRDDVSKYNAPVVDIHERDIVSKASYSHCKEETNQMVEQVEVHPNLVLILKDLVMIISSLKPGSRK